MASNILKIVLVTVVNSHDSLRHTLRVHDSYLHAVYQVTLCATFMFTLYRVKDRNHATETIHIPCLNLLPSTRAFLILNGVT